MYWLNGRLASTVVLMSATLILSSTLGIARDLLTTFIYGVSGQLDIFFLALFISTIHAGLYRTYVFQLVTNRFVHLRDSSALCPAIRAVLKILLVTAPLTYAGTLFGFESIYNFLAPMRPEQIQLAREYYFLMAPYAVFMPINAVFVEYFSLRQKYVLSRTEGVFQTVFVLVLLPLLATYSTTYALPAATGISAIGTSLVYWIIFRADAVIGSESEHLSTSREPIRIGFVYSTFIFALDYMRFAIERRALLSLVPGGLSAFILAQRIVLAINGLVYGVSDSMLKVKIGSANEHHAKTLFWRYSALSITFALISASLLYFAAEVIVRSLFLRGAFTQDNATAVVDVLQVVCLTLPFLVFSDSVHRAATGRGRNLIMAIGSAVYCLSLLALIFFAGSTLQSASDYAVAFLYATIITSIFYGASLRFVFTKP